LNQNRTFVAALGFTAMLIASAAAQPPAAGQSDTLPTTAATVPSGWLERADQNAWRGRTLIGAPVFNDNGQRIATINDLLVNDDGVVDRVVLLVTQRSQLVVVAFKQLRFPPSRSIATPVGRRAQRHLNQTNPTMFGVMLPGATRDSLASMETFRFAPSP
jgi:hypothetical protein